LKVGHGGFVCAFRGRRDSYQVPIALAEMGRLDAFVTDHFCSEPLLRLAKVFPRRVAERLLSRYDRRVPQLSVFRLRATAFAEAFARATRMPPSRIYDRFDPRYGRAAARCARRSKSDLLVYSSYAWEAFTASYDHDPRKILFQFHPHIRSERAILAGDLARSAKLKISFDRHLDSGSDCDLTARIRGDSAWTRADHVVCASSFTKRSLVAEGANPDIISVVPYGVEIPIEAATDRTGERTGGFTALFVGSGLQRKGLHHLLSAWRRARLPRGSRLTVVARTMDPGLLPLMGEVEAVDYVGGVTGEELVQLYRRASLFVMPSLVEGFGQVYLEALAHGTPVLGTGNTCCPDLGTEDDGVFVVPAGDVDALIHKLETLAARLIQDDSIRDRAKICAGRFTWEAFRRGIQQVAMGSTGPSNRDRVNV
jgi:glycosyltransferase involved in cell wall biosynthesis